MTWIKLQIISLLSILNAPVNAGSRVGLTASVLALPLLMLACAPTSSVDANEKPSVSLIPWGLETQDLDGPDEKTLLLRYYPPPNELPKAQIISSGTVEAAAEGIILSADWDFDSAVPPAVDGISFPFIWPKATSIDSSYSVVRFMTDVEPSVVFVEGFARLNPDGSGEPITVVNGDFDMRGPIIDYECSRFQTNPCMRINRDGLVELDRVPAEMFDLPHILVFAKWSVDPEDDPDGTAMANWVFHIAGE